MIFNKITLLKKFYRFDKITDATGFKKAFRGLSNLCCGDYSSKCL